MEFQMHTTSSEMSTTSRTVDESEYFVGLRNIEALIFLAGVGPFFSQRKFQRFLFLFFFEWISKLGYFGLAHIPKHDEA